jgi:hypothetical protein
VDIGQSWSGVLVRTPRRLGRCARPTRSMAVEPSNRRPGIARELLRYAVALSSTPTIFTSTDQSNLAMMGLLERENWQFSGELEVVDEDDPGLVFYNRSDGEVHQWILIAVTPAGRPALASAPPPAAARWAVAPGTTERICLPPRRSGCAREPWNGRGVFPTDSDYFRPVQRVEYCWFRRTSPWPFGASAFLVFLQRFPSSYCFTHWSESDLGDRQRVDGVLNAPAGTCC